MKRVAFFYWNIASETPPGSRIKSRHKMTEAQAKERDPTAIPLGEAEWRDVAETPDEIPPMWPTRKP